MVDCPQPISRAGRPGSNAPTLMAGISCESRTPCPTLARERRPSGLRLPRSRVWQMTTEKVSSTRQPGTSGGWGERCLLKLAHRQIDFSRRGGRGPLSASKASSGVWSGRYAFSASGTDRGGASASRRLWRPMCACCRNTSEPVRSWGRSGLVWSERTRLHRSQTSRVVFSEALGGTASGRRYRFFASSRVKGMEGMPPPNVTRPDVKKHRCSLQPDTDHCGQRLDLPDTEWERCRLHDP